MLTNGDLKSIERVVEKVIANKIDPFYEEFQEYKKEFQELKKEFQEYKKVSIEWFESIFDDLQGKHREMRQIEAQVSRIEKIQSIIT